MARFGTTGLNWRTDPRWCQFQKINDWTSLSLHICGDCLLASTEHKGLRSSLELSEQTESSKLVHFPCFQYPVRGMAPRQRAVHVFLKNVVPVILEREAKSSMLEQDLKGMGCIGFLQRLWNIKNKDFVREFVMIREKQVERSNIFDSTMWDQPEDWTAGVWRAFYHFLPRESGLANRTDKYVEDKFLHNVDPKDGFPVRECRNDWEHKVLEFLVPIVHPDKPTRVTRTLGNTIFGALDGDRLVDWAKIFMDLVHRLVGGAEKTKPTSICPFLYHLYESQGLLTEEEETDYRAAQELTKYRITPEPEPESAHESESEVRIITLPAPSMQKPKAPIPANWVKQDKRLEQTYRAPARSPLVRSKGEGNQPQPEQHQSEPQPKPVQPENPEEEEERPWVHKPFAAVIASYRQVKDQYLILERTLEEIGLQLDVEPRHILEHLRMLPKAQDLTDL